MRSRSTRANARARFFSIAQRELKSTRRASRVIQAAYQGRGMLRSCGGQIHAYDPRGKLIGQYTNFRAAFAALSDNGRRA